MEYVLILISLLFITGGQLLQKLAANKAMTKPIEMVFLHRILSQRETWWAIVCLAIGTALWLLVLYKMEVSKAVPFLSLGFVLVLLISHFYLHEIVRPARWIGVAFICAGIITLSLA